MVAALVAGVLADWFGRKMMMIAGGAMFVVSIFLIFISSGFVSLLSGRILMGLSGGVICVVVPLYMAECLPAQRPRARNGHLPVHADLGFVMAVLSPCSSPLP